MSGEITDFIMNAPAIDAHEHLLPERNRLESDVDALFLFKQYSTADLRSAGMPQNDYERIRNAEGTLEERWKLFRPYLPFIRNTGAARPVFIALRDLYGFDDLNDDNYQRVSEKIKEENTPGQIDRFLKEKAGIERILNCNYMFEQPTEYTHGIMSFPKIPLDDPATHVEKEGEEFGIEINDLESLNVWIEKTLSRYSENNVVGMKHSSRPWRERDGKSAERTLKAALRKNKMTEEDNQLLNDYVLDRSLTLVPRYGFTIPAHTGVFAGPNVFFKRTHVRNMVPLLLRHPEVKFDIFHLSYPWVDEAIAIAQRFSNAHLNLTWCPTLNPSVFQRAVSDIICSVPANKVLALGGDYWMLPDVAYGQLKMSRSLLAKRFDACVSAGEIPLRDAVDMARSWLRDNAYATYPLLNAAKAANPHSDLNTQKRGNSDHG